MKFALVRTHHGGLLHLAPEGSLAAFCGERASNGRWAFSKSGAAGLRLAKVVSSQQICPDCGDAAGWVLEQAVADDERIAVSPDQPRVA